MSASAEYCEYLLDQLIGLGPVALGRFFGGAGLSFADAQFAMIMGNTLYFAVDADSRPEYERRGMQPFSYAKGDGRVYVKKYYQVPEEIVENPEELLAWARKAAAVGVATKKRPKA